MLKQVKNKAKQTAMFTLIIIIVALLGVSMYMYHVLVTHDLFLSLQIRNSWEGGVEKIICTYRADLCSRSTKTIVVVSSLLEL